jgi:hypothetical protein
VTFDKIDRICAIIHAAKPCDFVSAPYAHACLLIGKLRVLLIRLRYYRFSVANP